MEQYVNDFSKMALALTSAQMAKDEAISEHGLGEELSIHFLAWLDNTLIAICQMNAETGKLNPEIRFDRCKELCKVLRRDMWSTAITMVSEGYCSLDSYKTKNMDLAVAFADQSLPVYECITVSHTSIDEDNDHVSPVSMVAAPYRIDVGRKVNWKEVLVYPEKADEYTRQTKYPTMHRKVLQMDPDESTTGDNLAMATSKIHDLGFIMQRLI